MAKQCDNAGLTEPLADEIWRDGMYYRGFSYH